MTIEPDKIGFVAGRKGCNLKRIKDTYGVNIRLPPKGGSQIILEGSSKIISAKKAIEDRISGKICFFIEREYRFLVAGQGGENVRSMREAHNVEITIQEDGEVMSGQRERSG